MIFENENDNEPELETDHSNSEAEEGATETGPDISEHEEAVARSRGWVPKDQYRGRETDWQDAKSFLDRNSSLKRDVDELTERLSRQEQEYQDRLDRIERAAERIIQNDRERLISQLEEAKRNAAELGDLDAYDRVKDQESQYYRRIAQEAREERERPAKQQKPEIWEETQDWVRRNSWFNEDANMQHIAIGFYNEAMEGMPKRADEAKRLAYVEKRMADVYPDKFGKNQAGAVESGRRSMQPSPPKLSADEEAACKRFIARGLIKDRAEYIKYLNE